MVGLFPFADKGHHLKTDIEFKICVVLIQCSAGTF